MVSFVAGGLVYTEKGVFVYTEKGVESVFDYFGEMQLDIMSV